MISTHRIHNGPAHDIVVVGGGIAGSAFATTMARSGATVLVLEREQRFRDRVRGEWLAPWGVEEATRLGLGGAFEAAGAYALPALAGRANKPRVETTPRGEVARTFEHAALQEALLAEAAHSGAVVLRGARVLDVDPEAPSVRFAHGGNDHVATARLVVGADGRNSKVRSAFVDRQRVHESGRLLAGVRLANVRSEPDSGYFILDDERAGVASLFPQGDGFARAYVFAQGDEPSSYLGTDGFARFIEAQIAMGVPAKVIGEASAAGPLAAFRADESWVERPADGALALIGDAASISDATWGMGIALALRDVRALSEALIGHLDWREATSAYAAEHDDYFATIQTAERWMSELTLTPGPEARRRRLRAMRRWAKEPERALNLPGLGPATDVSEHARVRFFAEDTGHDFAQERELATVGRSS